MYNIAFDILRLGLIFIGIFVFALHVRYYLHMLQLSSYQLPGYLKRLGESTSKINIQMFYYVLFAVLFPLISGRLNILGICFFNPLPVWHLISPAASFIIIAASIYSISIFSPKNEKKKFVVTDRIKRLMITLFLLLFAFTAVLSLFGRNFSGKIPFFVFLTVMFALPYMTALANKINLPIEKNINDGFIRDAQRILKEHRYLKILGVTGSFGKTSVKYYVTSILSESFDVLMTPESYNTPMGIVRTIREKLKPSHEIFVCEMGARHVGDIKEITDIVHPDDGIVTAIGEQHLETFFSLENIINTKYELFDEISSNSKGLMFANGDNENIRANMRYDNVITYGLNAENDFRAKNLEVASSGTTFKIEVSQKLMERLFSDKNIADEKKRELENTSFKTSLVGAHNVQNISGAMAIAFVYGMSAVKIARGVKRIAAVPHRLELKKHGNVTILDDAYNSNPAGAKVALETLSLFKDRIKILVTPGMVELGDREKELNKSFGKQAADVCDYIILVGEKRTAPIAEGISESGFSKDRLFVRDSFNLAAKLMYEIEPENEKVILLENDLPDNY